MKKGLFNQLSLYLIPVALFLVISFVFFSPILQGKRLQQSDVANYVGMSKEALDYQEKTGEIALWTNSMFGGMPTYLIINVAKNNLWKYLHQIFSLNTFKPVGMLFLYLLGFYIALLILGFSPWLSFTGALAYAFSSYFIIILEPGHITKALAIGYLPVIISSIFVAYHKSLHIGAVFFGIFLTLQIMVNHLQITYYTFIIILIFMIFELVRTIREKIYTSFLKTSLWLLLTTILAIGSNATNLWLTYEYGKYSTRGPSELTSDKENKTTGLDKDYSTAWSYGIDETITLLIPNAFGGASYTKLGENSNTFNYFAKNYGSMQAEQICKSVPTYWGTQPFTSGPVYVGAVIIFLFIFALFYLKGWIKWWMLTITILSIVLSWGKNFMHLTNFFLDHIPGYNKFRTVSMTLVIAEFAIPFLASFLLYDILTKEIATDRFKKALKWSLSILGVFLAIFWLLPNLFFDFTSTNDAQLAKYGYPINDIVADRESMFRSDAFRSLIFILLTGALLYLYAIKKILKHAWVIIAISILTLIDLWPVNKRFLHEDLYVSKQQSDKPFMPTEADLQILQDKDLYYRVLNLTVNTFNDASTSYFHKSIGGYHGAKMKRYQELIEHQIAKNNFNVLNMLNTKYFIVPDNNNKPVAQYNPNALGNAWFVKAYKLVKNADEELAALSDFKPDSVAIIDQRFSNILNNFSPRFDSSATIKLVFYSPNKLSYEYRAKYKQLTVFSDIYYDKGWNLYVDGKIYPYFRANYVLRAAILPEGTHKIDFIFEPQSYTLGEKISLASSLLLLIFAIFVLYTKIKKQHNK